MSHVLISGVTSCESRGVEALVRSVVTHGCRWPEQQIVVLTQTPALDAAALADLGPSLRCVADPFVVSRSWSAHRPFETEAELTARRKDLIEQACLVIGTGGDLHTPDYRVSTSYLRALAAAQAHQVPTVLIGQSWGPFTATEDAEALARVADGCALLSVRERVSFDYAVDALGLDPRRVRISADPAFLLPAALPERVANVLLGCDVAPDDTYLCLAPSQGITRYGNITDSQHLKALTELVTHLGKTWAAKVLLVPHCHDSRPHNDDRVLAEQIAAACTEQVQVIRGDLSCVDYKGVLAGASLVVSERLHAAIGALSSGVPTVVIGHSHKFSGVPATTYGDQVPVSRFHLDIDELDDSFTSWSLLLDRENAVFLRGNLAARMDGIAAAAKSDLITVRSLLAT